MALSGTQWGLPKTRKMLGMGKYLKVSNRGVPKDRVLQSQLSRSKGLLDRLFILGQFWDMAIV